MTAGDLVQSGEVRSGSSYLSQDDLRWHVGLGQQAVMDMVEVSWPSGRKEQYRSLSADFIYTIEEGSGIRIKQPFERSSPPRPAGQ